jgi:hypothetical protein
MLKNGQWELALECCHDDRSPGAQPLTRRVKHCGVPSTPRCKDELAKLAIKLFDLVVEERPSAVTHLPEPQCQA